MPPRGMLDRIWTTAKAVFGVALLVVCALLAAQKLDRERAEQSAQALFRAGGPEATGSITPAAPALPTRTPSE
ncbi:hypothetical protein AFCDBAGC_2094 [Methylobacterium cerastii]|uniref:Uncharacterized protein n=2 Tax=Methylobacteriaceae TaxID=119045 RepID=A0ABQ4QG76_9HYPH|nr:hypothetical protein [Methylobacterium sp. WL8]GJD44228.1 hypothetical protein AFCDBAGC_2094 [Methylobacterium cerastii]